MRTTALVIAILLAFSVVSLHGAVDASKGRDAKPTTAASSQPTTSNDKDFPPQPAIPYLTPEEEAKTFQLPEGYRMELVLAEPQIQEPVACVFDGHGRMYVPEMRTYMQNIDGTGEIAPGGRVSRHESSKGDGVFDKHTVFADQLTLPRMVLPLIDKVLINQTNSNDVLAFYDTANVGVSDKNEKWSDGGSRGGNLEHQQSGLLWCMDNWIYQSVNAIRLRVGPDGKALSEKTPPNGGQWGLTQDDYGKPWFSNGGGEKGPLRFQVPIIYGAFDLPNQTPEDFREVWPLVGLADYQGGPMRVRPSDKTLNHFTATCGQAIFRGDRLPADLRGDLLFAEPVGRLIRRAKIEDHEGLTYLKNAYDKSEFIRSTDPNFRPVNMTTGPDGCLYIVDMYRGIIQEGNWVKEGSYLRKVVKQYSLQNNFGRGRIWRLVHKDFKPGPQPHMLDETPTQLVAHLSHPNGWWRDTAQMLLVLRGDKSVVPALQQLARQDKNPLTRIHALWTLEGLGALDSSIIREKLKDENPHVRAAAIRAGESLLKDDTSVAADVRALAKDSDPGVVLQVLCTAKYLKWADFEKFAQLTLAATPFSGVKSVGGALLSSGKKIEDRLYSAADAARLHKGEAIYQELCYACHGYTGTGMPMDNPPLGPNQGATIGPPLAFSREVLDHPDTLPRILLKGLAGPVGGKEYTAQMVPMDTNSDDWIADVSSFVRNAFGNHASLITAKDVAALRAQTKSRATPWTIAELESAHPRLIQGQKDWTVTASHNPTDAKLAIDGNFDTRWTSKSSLAPGMWFQLELPADAMVGGVWLDSAKSTHDYPRALKVELSTDGDTWKKVIDQKGAPGVLYLTFPPTTTHFIRITQTGSLARNEKNLFWSIHELRLIAAPTH